MDGTVLEFFLTPRGDEYLSISGSDPVHSGTMMKYLSWARCEIGYDIAGGGKAFGGADTQKIGTYHDLLSLLDLKISNQATLRAPAARQVPRSGRDRVPNRNRFWSTGT